MDIHQISSAFSMTSRRLLLLDYDGVLAPIVERPEDAKPTDAVRQILQKLASLHGVVVVVISGRPREILDQWLGDLPVQFVAEHGVWQRNEAGVWSLNTLIDEHQREAALSVLEQLARQYPGTFVEAKRVGAALHYRQADVFNEESVKHWIQDNRDWLARNNLTVIDGKKVMELLPRGVDKGTAAQVWLDKQSWDFVLSVGDDTTDEAMFAVMPDGAFSIHVGNRAATKARLSIPTQADFQQLLGELY